jgi:gluconokinase
MTKITMFYIVMGVSGSGKSTVGKLLSDRLNCLFYDADDFHPSSNIIKMSQDIPLDDSDRLNWLLKLQQIITNNLKAQKWGVMACSALKEQYRQIITGNQADKIIWIYLRGDYNTIYQRLQLRENHFLKANLLDSQFAILEEPKNALTIDITVNPNIMVEHILQKIK